MGKSAKLHKKAPKKVKSSNNTGASSNPQAQVQTAKKKNLKAKAGKSNANQPPGTGVLGGADYVSLMMGGRRKAKEEAKKLPQSED